MYCRNLILRFLFLLFCIQSFLTGQVLTANDFTIAVKQPGLLILEASLDSIWISKTEVGRETINSKPVFKKLIYEGHPELPYFHTLLSGVPSDAQIQIFWGDIQNLQLTNPIATPTERAKGIDLEISLDPVVDNRFPKTDFTWKFVGVSNGMPVQSLEVYPVVMSRDNLLTIRKQTTIRLQWNPTGSNIGEVGFFTKIGGRSTPSQLGRSTLTIPKYQYSDNLLKIVVDTTGWYCINQTTLEDSGFVEPSMDPKTFRLWHRGEEQLLWFEGEEDGTFDGGDFILFFGEKNPSGTAAYLNNFYTDDNCYWLTWGEESGSRYVEELGYPTSEEYLLPNSYNHLIHVEQDERFERLGKINTDSTWDTFEHFFMTPAINSGTNVNYSLYIPHPLSSEDNLFSITTKFQGITDDDHYVSIFINGWLCTQGSWTGRSSTVISSSGLPNDILTDGENILTVFLTGGQFGRVHLDWVDINYERLYRVYEDIIEFTSNEDISFIYQFEIAGFSSPEIFIFKNGVSRIRDFITQFDENTSTYKITFQDWVESSDIKYTAFSTIALHSPKKIESKLPLSIEDNYSLVDSDYLIITSAEYDSILTPLADYHDATVVHLDDVYRRYNDGVMSPYVIKDFLCDVYHNWSPVPEYVLLVGQAYLGKTDELTLPTMFIQSYKWGATATDFWYALVDGNDFIPEFHIGRFPAKSEEELQVMVDKTLAYLDGGETGTWQNRFLMIAGYEVDFKNQSESLISSIVESGFFPDRLYIDKYSVGGPYFGTTDTLTNRINRGRTFINFFGHGGGAVWGDRSLFRLNDIWQLDNQDRLPVITSMTCFTGDISLDGALGNRLFSYEDGGVVAFWGSSGIGWIINDYLLLQPILSNLTSGELLHLGEIIDLGKISYISQNTMYPEIARSLVHQYTLIGDPALKLNFPSDYSVTVEPMDPEPGDTIQILVGGTNPPTIEMFLYDSENSEIQQQPFIIEKTNSQFQWQLPDTLLPGNYTMNFAFIDDDSTVFHKSVPISISGSNAFITDIDPAEPTHKDSIFVTAFISDQQGVDSAIVVLSGYTQVMDSIGANMYRSASPFSPQNPGSTIQLWLEVWDDSDSTNWTKSKVINLTIPPLPNFSINNLEFKIGDNIQMSAIVTNSTTGPGMAECVLERDSLDIWTLVDTTSTNFEGLSSREVYFDGSFYQGVWNYRVTVNPDSSTDETNYSDNQYYDTFETTSFLVTPDSAAYNTIGISGMSVIVPPNSVTSVLPVTLGRVEEINLDNQPDFTAVPFDSINSGIGIDFSGEIDSFLVEWSWSDTIADYGSLYQWYPEYETWLEISAISDTAILFRTNSTSQFAWLHSGDTEGPTIEATVNGLRFLQNSYISASPQISVVIQDENGIDFRDGAICLLKNGEVFQTSIEIPETGAPNVLTFQFTPGLSVEDSSLGILVVDATGNPSDTLTLTFMVKEELDLIDYGNFPNPFKDLTIFAYELTHTVDEFSLEIYSVAGEPVKRFDEGTVISELTLSTAAYHEIYWYGKDSRGDFVDNGIYFYRMRAKKGKTTLEKFGKVAKGR